MECLLPCGAANGTSLLDLSNKFLSEQFHRRLLEPICFLLSSQNRLSLRFSAFHYICVGSDIARGGGRERKGWKMVEVNRL
jgi:hypothetical protein